MSDIKVGCFTLRDDQVKVSKEIKKFETEANTGDRLFLNAKLSYGKTLIGLTTAFGPDSVRVGRKKPILVLAHSSVYSGWEDQIRKILGKESYNPRDSSPVLSLNIQSGSSKIFSEIVTANE